MTTITKDNGEIVSAAYLRSRVSTALSLWRRYYSKETRRAVMDETVSNAEWMRGKNGCTVGAVCRAVESVLMDRPFETDHE